MKYTPIIALIFAVGLLAAATPAQAVYIETPLVLDTPDKADAGDKVDLSLGPHPENESAQEDWAGKTVKLRYSYDKNENQQGGPDDATSNAGHTEGDIAEITLDDKARATRQWTIPAEVDGFNVAIFAEDADGERLAFRHMAVGNATPVMYVMSGPSDGQPETNEGPLEEAQDESGEAASLGVIGLLAALGVALLVTRRRD